MDIGIASAKASRWQPGRDRTRPIDCSERCIGKKACQSIPGNLRPRCPEGVSILHDAGSQNVEKGLILRDWPECPARLVAIGLQVIHLVMNIPRLPLSSSRRYQARETAREDQLSGTPLAGFLARAAGLALDLFLVFRLQDLVGLAWTRFVPHDWEHHTLADIPYLRGVAVLVIYFAGSFYFANGRTFGKWVAGTRVVSLKYQKLSVAQCVQRALGYGTSFIELGGGFLQFFTNRNHQCSHDRLAETIVIDTRPSVQKAASQTGVSE